MQKEDENLGFVQYNPVLWCHIYQNVKPIVPFLFKGRQGWTNVDESILKQIKYESIEEQLKNFVKELKK